MHTLHYLNQSPENIYITFKSWHHCNDIQVLGDRNDFYKVITRDERIADKLFIYETDEDGNDLPADEWRDDEDDIYDILCEGFNLCEFSAREMAAELYYKTDWWGRHADEEEE